MEQKQEIDNKKVIWAAFAFSLMVGGTLLAYFFHEEKTKAMIKKCSKVTIAYPERFVSRATIYYYFNFNGKKIRDGVTMTFPTMGKFERGSHLMKERFWVQVNCDDYNVNRIYWEAKVPDTLQFIPSNGWNKMPYGL